MILAGFRRSGVAADNPNSFATAGRSSVLPSPETPGVAATVEVAARPWTPPKADVPTESSKDLPPIDLEKVIRDVPQEMKGEYVGLLGEFEDLWSRGRFDLGELKEYGLEFLHKEGKSHTDADAVFCLPVPRQVEHSIDIGAPLCQHCFLPSDGSTPLRSGFNAAVAGVKVIKAKSAPTQAIVPFLEKVRRSEPTEVEVKDVFEYLQKKSLPEDLQRRRTMLA
uniref:Uncharacterized protein n=1 Tax=Chromera velia CCMP2878 TaxID=1169474 RepID=A0A0G4F263_9ALVE|eukprot:Cvel_2665.t1-p1 / transcript=Cvel_2665.t1 / gene=Cvel_2665 / organism=Chromera_velia_CCMP2878 / gene_product=hypothetical protein / transcript_product=hypothetical protein / location=Cvel_scaffold106:55606-58390(+) / protein_length=222 / sequence_SO=supercontig / SO=protein_coding / is_pseudo=false